MYKHTLIIFNLALFFSCSSSHEQPDVSGIKVELSLIRLEDQFRDCKSIEKVKEFIDKYPTFAKGFLAYKEDEFETLAKSIVSKTTLPQYDTLFFACKKNLSGIESSKDELLKAFKYFKYYYRGEKLPTQIYTLVTGYEGGGDLFVNDSIIVWGLEFCLGSKTLFRPPVQLQLHGYMLDRMTPPFLPINFMLSLSTRFNKYDPLNQTMISDMIFYGKSYYFLERMFPSYPDSLLIGFSEQQLADAHFNEREIWGHFIKKDLLYENRVAIKNRYLDERPKVSEIAEECPGRIGRWLGWQIVRSYMKQNPSISLQELMETADAQKLFQDSKYKPKQPK